MTGQQNTLYRKYRPKRFDEVVGQSAVLKLRDSIAEHNSVNAYLFTGTRGSGKTTTARLVAAALNCLNLGKDGEPCNECEPCELTRDGQWPGVYNELDAASNNGVENVRSLTSTMNLSSMSNKRIYIIDEVHMLTQAASNALLKSLEEPPADVVFILATTNPEKLLETVKSRTVHIKFRNLATEELLGLVTSISEKENLDLSEEILGDVALSARGSARDAISNLQSAAMGINPENVSGIQRLQDALIDKSSADALIIISELVEDANSTFNPIDYSDRIIDFMRNSLIYQQNPELAKNVMFLDQVEIMAESCAGARLVRSIDTLAEARLLMRDGLNNRTLLEVSILKLLSPSARAKEDGYLSAIEDLIEAVKIQGSKIESQSVQIAELKSLVKNSSRPDSSSVVPDAWPPIREETEETTEEPEAEIVKPKGRKPRKVEPEPEDEPESPDDSEDSESDGDSDDDKKLAWENDKDMYKEWTELFEGEGWGTKARASLESADLKYDAKSSIITVTPTGRVSSMAIKKLERHFDELGLDLEIAS